MENLIYIIYYNIPYNAQKMRASGAETGPTLLGIYEVNIGWGFYENRALDPKYSNFLKMNLPLKNIGIKGLGFRTFREPYW